MAKGSKPTTVRIDATNKHAIAYLAKKAAASESLAINILISLGWAAYEGRNHEVDTYRSFINETIKAADIEANAIARAAPHKRNARKLRESLKNPPTVTTTKGDAA